MPGLGAIVNVLARVQKKFRKKLSQRGAGRDPPSVGSDHYHDRHDGRADLPRIEIDVHGLVHRKQAGLVATETDGEWRSAFEESHERDLNVSIHVTELHEADGSLECGGAETGANENISAGSRIQERQSGENGKKEARHNSPPPEKSTPECLGAVIPSMRWSRPINCCSRWRVSGGAEFSSADVLKGSVKASCLFNKHPTD